MIHILLISVNFNLSAGFLELGFCGRHICLTCFRYLASIYLSVFALAIYVEDVHRVSIYPLSYVRQMLVSFFRSYGGAHKNSNSKYS